MEVHEMFRVVEHLTDPRDINTEKRILKLFERQVAICKYLYHFCTGQTDAKTEAEIPESTKAILLHFGLLELRSGLLVHEKDGSISTLVHEVITDRTRRILFRLTDENDILHKIDFLVGEAIKNINRYHAYVASLHVA